MGHPPPPVDAPRGAKAPASTETTSEVPTSNSPAALPGRRARLAQTLRAETVGGALLLLAAVVALVWINSPAGHSYEALRDVRVGPAALHLDLSLGAWAADGLLAIFFFVVGLELKREFVAGDLRDPARAAVPIVAALGGVAVPAGLYVLANLGGDATDALAGWAIPTATDIAFALAVLAIVATHLPSGVRTFLLTLAVVDDLVAVTIIALFYTDDLRVLPLVATLVPLAAFAAAVQRGGRVWGAWWVLVPLALVTWGLMHASGVHATVAGVLLGFTVPVLAAGGSSGGSAPHHTAAGHPGDTDHGANHGPAERIEHRIRPLSAGVAVPIFAFFAAGVDVGGLSGLVQSLTDPVAIGIVAGLVLGKPIGIVGAAWLTTRLTRARLDDELAWLDVLGVALLGGIGFTVSLLIGDLAFGAGSPAAERAKVAILTASLIAAALAAVLVKARDRTYARRATADRQSA